MRTMKSQATLAAGSMAVLLALVGCAGNNSGSSAGDAPAGTVAVDVGNHLTVDLKTGHGLKVGVFIPGVANEYGLAQKAGAEETAAALGMKMTLFDAGYDPTTQLNQLQTAVSSGDFDAAVVMSMDGAMACKLLTQDLAKANVLVSIIGGPLCANITKVGGVSGDEGWSPGTLNYIDSNNTRDYAQGVFGAAAAANPGPQKILIVGGPATNGQTRIAEAAQQSLSKADPGYEFEWINSDWTTTNAYNLTQTYLQGHPDTTVIMSMSSPDITMGIVQAVKDAGLTGRINVVSQGLGKFQLEQIEAGNIQLATLFFPFNQMKLSLESIAAAQTGAPGPRFVDDSLLGSSKQPFVVTKKTLSQLPADVR